MGNIVCSIDSNETVAEAPESVQLERGLNTEHTVVVYNLVKLSSVLL
jgi:hypothetical protein